MQVRLLGPVDVVVDGEPRPVRGLRRKAILAVLALNHGMVVSSDRLTNLVWGEAGLRSGGFSAAPTSLTSPPTFLGIVSGGALPRRNRQRALGREAVAGQVQPLRRRVLAGTQQERVLRRPGLRAGVRRHRVLHDHARLVRWQRRASPAAPLSARQRASALEHRLAGCRAVVCPGSFVGRQGVEP